MPAITYGNVDAEGASHGKKISRSATCLMMIAGHATEGATATTTESCELNGSRIQFSSRDPSNVQISLEIKANSVYDPCATDLL